MEKQKQEPKPWEGMESLYRQRYFMLSKNFFEGPRWNPKTNKMETVKDLIVSCKPLEFAEHFFLVNRNLVLSDFENYMFDLKAWAIRELETAAFYHLRLLTMNPSPCDDDIAKLFVRFSKLGEGPHYQVRTYCQKLIMEGRPLPSILARFAADFLSGLEYPSPPKLKSRNVHKTRNREFFISCIMHLLIEFFDIKPYANLSENRKPGINPRKNLGRQAVEAGWEIIEKAALSQQYEGVSKTEKIDLTKDEIKKAFVTWRPFFKKYLYL
jgi:hypothetical protein